MKRFFLKCLFMALTLAVCTPFNSSAQLASGTLDQSMITPLLAARYRAIRASGTAQGNNDEFFIGTPDIGQAGNRYALNFSYRQRIEFTLTYDAVNETFSNTTRLINAAGNSVNYSYTINNLHSFLGNTKVSQLARMNYMQMELELNNGGNNNGTVSIQDLQYNNTPVTGTYSVAGKNTVSWFLLDVNFATGFTISGTVLMGGTSFNASIDQNRLDFSWGHYSGFAILPIRIINLKGLAENGKQNKITWNTSDNDEGKYFEIERSADGRSFTTIDRVSVSDERSSGSYVYYDRRPLSLGYYRVKAVDINNKQLYSATIKVAQKFNETKLLQQTKQTELLFPDAGQRTVEVYSMNGTRLANTITSGNHYVIPHYNLKKGVYVLRVSGAGNDETRQFMVL